MAKIALIHPKSPNPAKKDLIWPPLGLCRIASYLEKRGHKVDIIEQALYKTIPDNLNVYDFVGIGAMSIQHEEAIKIAKKINTVSICGGPHFSSLPDTKNFSACVIGDGEIAMKKIIEDGVRGIIKGESIKEYIPVDFDKLNYLKYGDHLIDGRRAISIISSRGCLFNCKFCEAPNTFGKRITNYPLEDVVENMKDLSRKYDIKCFRMMDDYFIINKKRVRKFCDLVRPLDFSMACLSGVKTVDYDMLKYMKASGFEYVAIGLESSSNDIIKIMGKHHTVEQSKKACEIVKKAGLKLEALFIIGSPGETKTTLYNTIDFAKSINAYRVHAQFFTPTPGCGFYKEITKHGVLLEKDFTKYNHRSPVFLPNGISYSDLLAGADAFFEVTGRTRGS